VSIVGRIEDWAAQKLGDWASTHVVVVLAAVLALDSADRGSIGAMAPELEQALGIGQTELGLMVTVTTFAGAVGTLLFGWLVDRVSRTRVLLVAITLWSAVMIVCAGAPSYLFLLIARAGLGVVVAAALPAIASLTGDYFQPHRRAHMYGYILVGQFVGTGIGMGVTGELAIVSWRLGFGFLVVLGACVAWMVYRLPEPERGGAGRLRPGQPRIADAFITRPDTEQGDRGASHVIEDLVRQSGVSPRPHMVLDENPGRKPLLWAVEYVLHIPTNLILIIASALGYYFYAGARTFGVEFMQGWFRVSHTTAIGIVGLFGAAALVGVLWGGRLADWLLMRRYLTGRVIVSIVAYLAAAVFFLIAVLTRDPAVAVPVLMLAGLSFGAINPPVDAARLDIMHPYLWGRAEAVRALLRLVAEGLAPLLFGLVADQIFGGGPIGTQRAFLVMVVPLFISGGIGFIAFRTYPRDVATADAYTRRTQNEAAR
jgi:predicted MFS family arabinose efflux permease